MLEVRLESDSKACRCLVPADQLSLAIGKEGQNARLAARLTSYKIDIKPQGYQEPEAEDASEENAEEPMADLPANLTEDLLTDLPADEETEEPVEE